MVSYIADTKCLRTFFFYNFSLSSAASTHTIMNPIIWFKDKTLFNANLFSY